jgi:hypothetical protein
VCACLRVRVGLAVQGYEVVMLPLEPGDVAFMHSNTLHASSPNLSDMWRRNIIIAYNSKHNAPLVLLYPFAAHTPCPVRYAI